MATSFFILGLAGLSTLADASPIKVRGDGGGKRGIAYNNFAMCNLFDTSSPKFSWMYNWVSTEWNAAAWGKGIEYVPMLHSAEDQWTSVWNTEVDMSISKGAKHVLSFNEPDQCGGGGTCMTDAGQAASDHKTYVDSVRTRHPDIKIGSPAVTSDAQDPNKGLRYLNKFLAACSDCKIDFIAAHWNGPAADLAYFKQHLEDTYNAGGQRPVWVTEFKCFEGESGDPAARAVADQFLKDAMKYLDEQPWIERYAYFYASPGVLVNAAGNGLSDLGTTYTTY